MRSCGLKTFAGRQLDGDALGHALEGARRLAVGSDRRDRPAGVAALPQLRHQRELGEQRDAELVGQLLAAAGAEELVALAVVAR